MLLQGSQSARNQTPSVPAPAPVKKIDVPTPPPPAAFVTRRDYAPISWETPGLGRSVAEGLGGISRTVVIFMLAGAMLVGTAIAVAMLVAGVVHGFGFDATGSY